MSDVEVGRAMAAADVDALAMLYDRYASLAYSIALRIVGDEAKAEDVVQESFLNLWRNAAAFDPGRGSLRAWLVASVRNRAIDQLRGRARYEKREVELAVAERAAVQGGTDPWREVSVALEREAVTEALRRLPAEQKQAIELAYYGGYSQREIAEMARVPLSTVKGRMRLALEKLHSYLEGKGLFDER